MENGICEDCHYSKRYKKPLKQCIKAIMCVYLTISIVTFGLYYTIPSGKILYNGEDYISPFFSKVNANWDIILSGNEKVTADVSPFSNFRLCSVTTGNYNVNITALGFIPVKTMEVSVIPRKYLVPDGRTVGIKLNTGGITVLSVSQEPQVSSVRDAGIQSGDVILAINDVAVLSSDALCQIVDNSGGQQIKITIRRDGKTMDCYVTPVIDERGGYRLGLWMKDGVSGIGTLTYYDPQDKTWGALGHGISDDSGEIADASGGQLLPAGIVSVTKSSANSPGEMKGYICETDQDMGQVKINSSLGIYGITTNKNLFYANALRAATRSEVTQGEATILTAPMGGEPQSYSVFIEKVYRNTLFPGKGMLIRITDKRLLDETGGIVQGMSGSPIIQNGLFVGAVTHVLVKDPTYGYGIFIDSMINQAENISQ
ncbi:MAG: SpoIVB peptidase [Eubacteriales bacterium]|nr:SpoIVB peptidase [Eubacteriales bacterium]